MALTPDETAFARAELGADVNLADVETRRNRSGSLAVAVLEVLRERLAALRSSPASVSLPGGLSVNNTANIAALEKQLAGLSLRLGLGDGVLRQHQPRPRRPRR